MDFQKSVEFYDRRYSKDYMAYWEDSRKRRIYEVIKGIPLPKEGKALDFGCGNGILTEVLSSALPGWEVYGTDISSVAIENATNMYSDIHFMLPDQLTGKFDFIMTHHVLEHVFDLRVALDQIANISNGYVLHMLPCGNPGSLEHWICNMKKGGIDKDTGTLCIEDEGHLRRLTSDQLIDFLPEFALVDQKFGNQWWGAVEWISQSNPSLIFELFSPLDAKSGINAVQLIIMGLGMLMLDVARLPTTISRIPLNGWRKFLYPLLVLYPISKPFDNKIREMAEKEWRQRNREKNGSGMYLLFRYASAIEE